jgi:hypothetical protein
VISHRGHQVIPLSMNLIAPLLRLHGLKLLSHDYGRDLPEAFERAELAPKSELSKTELKQHRSSKICSLHRGWYMSNRSIIQPEV